MNNNQTSSFGLYEANRILVPGFYFASLSLFFFNAFVSRYITLQLIPLLQIILFIFLSMVSGFTMYAKETTKRRRAFIENQPSSFIQEITRKISSAKILSEKEARELYFFILNNYIPPSFHNKIFFFGTIYHIMIQIRRTSFWFAIISIICLAIESSMGIAWADQQGLIVFCFSVCLIYLLNVKYNKADRKMQENYQDQIFWLQLNEQLINELLEKYFNAKRTSI